MSDDRVGDPERDGDEPPADGDRDRDSREPSLLGRLVSPVWNAAEHRPRAPVRLLTAAALAVVALVVAGSGAAVAGLSAPLSTVLPMLAVAGATLLSARYVDRRRLSDLGLRREPGWIADLGAGLALGVLLQALIAGVGVAAGWFRVVDAFVGSVAGGATVLLVFLVVGVYEELFARGLLLVNVAEGLRFAGDRVAVGVALAASSATFGLLHAGNPGASTASTVGITLAGLFLGVGFALTGRLSFPVGVHVSWNAAQGLVFGFPVSGLGVEAAVVDLEPTGPTLVTGGSFGPEAGLLGMGAVLVGVAATAWWVRVRDGLPEGLIDSRIAVPDLRGKSESENGDEHGGSRSTTPATTNED
ncbi:CPBP family intramembrane metalloprotease [Halobaculum sp. CBA1158]|uniref:CPBP family intramembrane glutamic endopeptidase n=1 Tax=Halobaculum sp. CBA1158 TaxID=2904243 RepID=UPI001F3F49B1|nr:CPBP family intramembrane glutamic endopeptidase [Halobaculum sp. CBA1158]UIO99976.1 CPBP family intramembrane metalloprotease [Halobaculum sp. CBA1158]